MKYMCTTQDIRSPTVKLRSHAEPLDLPMLDLRVRNGEISLRECTQAVAG
jgi:hypothetical protein